MSLFSAAKRTDRFSALLATLRPTLVGWASIPASPDHEGGRARQQLDELLAERVALGDYLDDIRQEIARLERAQQTTKSGLVLAEASASLQILDRDRRTAEYRAARQDEEWGRLTRRLADTVARHNQIVDDIAHGYEFDRSEGRGKRMSADDAQRLAEESRKLVGLRLPRDDREPPKPDWFQAWWNNDQLLNAHRKNRLIGA